MSLSRRTFLATGAAACLAPAVRAQQRRTNVLFLVVDDLRPQLGCYGHRQMRTPQIDQLAAEGFRFDRAYCQQAVCAPSRASVLSGCRPDTTRIYDLETPLRRTLPDVLTLPQHFRQAGYTTLSRGKVYHHGLRDDPPGWSEPPWSPSGTWQGRGYLSPAAQARAQGQAKGVGPFAEAADVPDEAYPDGQIANQLIADLQRLRDQPFFLAGGFAKPHLPFCAPRRYWELYRREQIDLADHPFAPRDCPPVALHTWGELRQYHGIPKDGPLPDELAREVIHGYYAATSYVDSQIGRVLAALRQTGLADRTAVVLWGDHGWNLGEHGLWCKHANFECAVHAPLLLRLPGQSTRGGSTTALTEFVDLYPTLCEAAGLPLPEHLEGNSLLPLLERPQRAWKQAAFSQYPRGPRMGYSLRTARYRYTRWQERDGTLLAAELYDHQQDPGEQVNRAADPALATVRTALDGIHAAGWRAARPA
ncbi:MAG: sulfatase [Fimbriimonadaceae bacterium]|nr:sulfatase [Fimbriimonadaceae bacterium]